MSDRLTLGDVYEAYRTDPAFDHFRTPGVVLVPGEGSSKPNVFVVGEAPGATENTAKRPFVGASGAVLRSLISDSAGIAERDLFITNVVKYRPRGNRTPEPEEISASLPYLRQEYAALGSPKVVIAVGATAKAALAPQMPGVLGVAGRPLPFGRNGAKLWIMVHPAYGLRNPAFRPEMEKHWTHLGDWYRKEFQ